MNIDEKIGELQAEIEAKNKQKADIYAELDKIRKERDDKIVALKDALREKYGSFIGRVVQVSGRDFCDLNTEAEGILAFEAFTAYNGYVLPVLCKIKKDGTASKNYVPEWKLPKVDETFTIKLKHHD